MVMHKQEGVGLLVVLLAFVCSTGTAFAETPSFDPDQPFRQTFNSTMLRAMLNRTLDLIEDHIEIVGDVDRKDPSGEQKGRFSLKVYPKGKSQSDEHVAAEGWFRFSPDLGRQDFHLRFQGPHESSGLPSSPPEDVL